MRSTPELRVETVDVLIVGTGGAGMRAAIEAKDRGAKRVAMLAKGNVRATHTRMTGGRYNVVTGINQKDDIELFFKDTVSGGQDLPNQQLVKVLVEEALDRVYDLEAYGYLWERTSPEDYLVVGAGGGSQLRTLGSYDEGIGLVEVMLHEVWRRKVEIFEHHFLIDLVLEQGEVVGALALDLQRGQWMLFESGAVVLATGGNSQFYETNSGPSLNTGDGIAVALRAGAEVLDIEFMQFIPIAFVYPQSIRGYTLTEPQYYGRRHWDVEGEPGKLYNTKGERFIMKHDPERREGGTRDIIARAIMLEILAGHGTEEGGVWLEPDEEVFDHFLHERPLYVKRIMENYGEKAARFKERFQIMPSALYMCGGIRIDEYGRSTVPGLLAGGEIAGGIHGANRLGGNSMPDIQVFGRRAGIGAAERAQALGRPRPCPRDWAQARAAELDGLLQSEEGVRPPQVKKQILQLMWNHVGLVRSGEKLTETMGVFRDLREQMLPRRHVSAKTRVMNREWMEAIELENMLEGVEAMATAALHRTETRGNHYRQDFPDKDDANWLANIYLKRVDGQLQVEKRPVVRLPQQEVPSLAKRGRGVAT